MATRKTAPKEPAAKRAIYELYEITCLADGRRYIGCTYRGIEGRYRDHLKAARLGEPCGLYDAMREHGQDQFVVRAFATAFSLDWMFQLETLLIQQENTLWPNGLNMTTGVDGARPSMETRRRQSAIATVVFAAPALRQMRSEQTTAYWADVANRERMAAQQAAHQEQERARREALSEEERQAEKRKHSLAVRAGRAKARSTPEGEADFLALQKEKSLKSKAKRDAMTAEDREAQRPINQLRGEAAAFTRWLDRTPEEYEELKAKNRAGAAKGRDTQAELRAADPHYEEKRGAAVAAAWVDGSPAQQARQERLAARTPEQVAADLAIRTRCGMTQWDPLKNTPEEIEAHRKARREATLAGKARAKARRLAATSSLALEPTDG